MASMKTCRWLALLAGLAVSTAVAEVTLDTEVRKVVSTLDAGGRVERQLVPVEEVVPGEVLRYTITFSNDSETVVEPERIVVINPIPDGTVYVPGSAGGEGSVVEYSVDGETWSRIEPQWERSPDREAAEGERSPDREPAAAQPGEALAAPAGAAPAEPSPVQSLRWIYQQPLPPGNSEAVYFHVRMR